MHNNTVNEPFANPADSATILLVDDEDQLRDFLTTCLTRAGYQVSSAANGFEALALIDRRPNAIDLIVSDINMPRMSGVELTKSVRLAGVRCPILLMSGTQPPESVQMVCDVFLAKPFPPRAFLSTVAGMLDTSTEKKQPAKCADVGSMIRRA